MIEPVCAKFKGEKEVVVKQLASSSNRKSRCDCCSGGRCGDFHLSFSLSLSLLFDAIDAKLKEVVVVVVADSSVTAVNLSNYRHHHLHL